MTLKEYIAAHGHETHLTLVGPLVDAERRFNEPVIFVDGGAKCRRGNEGITVGDGDSSARHMDEKLNPDKDLSDLAHTLDAIEDYFDELHTYGFLGGRKDHELINLAEIQSLLRKRTDPLKVKCNEEIVAVSKGEWTFTIEGIFSLFLFEAGNLTLTGACKYPIGGKNPLHSLTSHGLSNEGNGEIVLICSGPVFIFLNSE